MSMKLILLDECKKCPFYTYSDEDEVTCNKKKNQKNCLNRVSCGSSLKNHHYIDGLHISSLICAVF